MSDSFDFGRAAENFAVEYFTALNYKVLAKNFISQKAEIDLILQKEDSIIMVEVKARKYKIVANPEEAVTKKKEKIVD